MSTICPNCFRHNFRVNCYDGPEICVFCGYDLKAKPEASLRLPPGTVLKKRYIIGTESTNDGTYQIYRACDIKKDSEVTVWELLPPKLEKRMENGSISFSDEEMKKKFQQSCDELICKCSIIKNLDIEEGMLVPLDSFTENGTVYIVTEAITGDTLLDYRSGIGGRLSKREAFTIMLPILKSIGLLNKYDLKHGGVWLSSMYFTQNGKIKLGALENTETAHSDTDKTSDINDAGFALLSLIAGGADAHEDEEPKDISKGTVNDKLAAFGLNKSEAVPIAAAIYSKGSIAETGAMKKLIMRVEKTLKESRTSGNAQKDDTTISITGKRKKPLVWAGAVLILIGLSIIGLLFAADKISPMQAETQEAEETELPEETSDFQEIGIPEMAQGERRAEEIGMP